MEIDRAYFLGPSAPVMADARIPFGSCPLCGNAEHTVELIGDCSGHPLYKPQLPKMQRWLRCRGCNHVYVDGYFSPEALKILFSSANPGQIPGANIEEARFTSGRMVETVIEQQSTPGGRWLDVGFGSGALMTTAEEFGFQVVGLDLRANCVQLVRKFGYEAHVLDFETYRSEEPFDVISMADVLEHMPYPKPALKHARELLRPDGLLFVSMPNADCLVWKVLNEHGANAYWGEIEHYHNFGRRRLYALFAECGFNPVRYGISARYRAGMEVIAKNVAARL